ncbi:hypothetical protein C6341_g18714, partial [Phytophthora cactorum]
AVRLPQVIVLCLIEGAPKRLAVGAVLAVL